MRRTRTFFEKIVNRANFRCANCGAKWHVRRAIFAFMHRYCECPICDTRFLARLAKRDKIDKMSRHPIRWILGLVGAPIYHCTFCRYQFHDWRQLDPRRINRRAMAAQQAAGGNQKG